MSSNIKVIVDGTNAAAGEMWAHYNKEPQGVLHYYEVLIPSDLLFSVLGSSEEHVIINAFEESDHLLNGLFRLSRVNTNMLQWVCVTVDSLRITPLEITVKGGCVPFKKN